MQADYLIIKDVQNKIANIEAGLKERKHMSEDFYHEDRAELLFEKLRKE